MKTRNTILASLLMALCLGACGQDTTDPVVPKVVRASDETDGVLTPEEFEELMAKARLVGQTVAATGYGGEGIPGQVSATTDVLHVPFFGMLNQDMHWTYRRDGFTFSNHRFKYGAFNHLEDQVSVPVDCDAITEEGSISANTSHHGLWTIPVSGINEIINMTMDREDETSDSETCPPPQTDTYDVEERNPNGGSGSGGEGEPTEDSGWCLVRVTYVVATGRIIDVDILFCW